MTMNTRITAVRTEFCRSNSSWRMSFDLSWLKLTSVPSGSSLLELLGDGLHLIHRLDQVRAGALGHLDRHGGRAVQPGDGLGFLQRRPDRRRCRGRGRWQLPVDTTGRFATSSAVSSSDGTLIA